MQFIKTTLRLVIFFLPVFCYGQSTTLQRDSKFQQLLERMEIKEQYNLPLNLSSATKPYTRSLITAEVEMIDSFHNSSLYGPVDFYNIERLLMSNYEWVKGDRSRFASKHAAWWNTFYKTPADLFQVNEKDFFLVINPVGQAFLAKEKDNDETVFQNTKGFEGRGLIADRLGFDFYVTDNQERTPLFVQSMVQEHRAVPGAGFYKSFKTTGYDYFDARGSIYFSAAKYIHFQFGYDKNFIGNGYRSLFLSDNGNSNLFLKINTRIWKLDYQNLFMELVPGFIKTGDDLLPRKYAVMHRLGLQATKWLNVGLFESVIFGRKDHFDFTYLNPIIFLRSIEQQNGSPDNSLLGIDYKANVAKKFQFYGQILLDEFKLSEVRAGNGWWGNKFGVQVGGKYIDAFKVKNLDLQGELNVVRPFTYSHYDSVASYTHYNQPLAHPLGANFTEVIGIVRFQPFPKWYGQLKLIAFSQGKDTASMNFGSNIFLPNATRSMDYGNKLGSGLKTNGINLSASVAYEIRENLFIDASMMYRRIKAEERPDLFSKTTLFSIGLRKTIKRREYDY